MIYIEPNFAYEWKEINNLTTAAKFRQLKDLGKDGWIRFAKTGTEEKNVVDYSIIKRYLSNTDASKAATVELGIRQFISSRNLTPGKVIQFTYDAEQKHAVVLDPEWNGKMHALSLKSVDITSLSEIFKLIKDNTDGRAIYSKLQTSRFIENRPYRTYLLSKVSALREIFIKPSAFSTLDNEKQDRFETAFEKGEIEYPIALKFSDKDYHLLAGNTRLTGLIYKGEENPKLWVIDMVNLTKASITTSSETMYGE